MWRLCDLHTHTGPDDASPRLPAADVVSAALDAGIDVLALTDHGTIDAVEDLMSAAEGTGLTVIPGVEVDSTSGHIVVLAPGSEGFRALREFVTRCGIQPNQTVRFEDLTGVARDASGPTSGQFAESIALVGAHVDQTGSLLASGQPLSVEGQLRIARQLWRS